MRNVYQAPIMADAAIIRDMLAQAGIQAQLVESDSPYPGATSPSQVWVGDADGDRALELIHKLQQSRDNAEQKSWRCRSCREDNPGEFDVCWSCGTERPW